MCSCVYGLKEKVVGDTIVSCIVGDTIVSCIAVR